MSRRTVWVEVEVKAVTDLAVLVDNGKREVWVPKSLIIDESDDLLVGTDASIDIAESLAYEKELI